MPQVTDEAIARKLDTADVDAKLALLLQAQRQTGMLVEHALHAQITRDESSARLWNGLAALVELPPKMLGDRWGAPTALLLAITFSVTVLTMVGIDIDVNELADTAAYAWQGEPACPTSVDIGPSEEVP